MSVELRTLKNGEAFHFAEPLDEDYGMVYRVVEADEIRPLVECVNTGMSIYPTCRLDGAERVAREE